MNYIEKKQQKPTCKVSGAECATEDMSHLSETRTHDWPRMPLSATKLLREYAANASPENQENNALPTLLVCLRKMDSFASVQKVCKSKYSVQTI